MYIHRLCRTCVKYVAHVKHIFSTMHRKEVASPDPNVHSILCLPLYEISRIVTRVE